MRSPVDPHWPAAITSPAHPLWPELAIANRDERRLARYLYGEPTAHWRREIARLLTDHPVERHHRWFGTFIQRRRGPRPSDFDALRSRAIAALLSGSVDDVRWVADMFDPLGDSEFKIELSGYSNGPGRPADDIGMAVRAAIDTVKIKSGAIKLHRGDDHARTIRRRKSKLKS